jgi:hypothetical protein
VGSRTPCMMERRSRRRRHTRPPTTRYGRRRCGCCGRIRMSHREWWSGAHRRPWRSLPSARQTRHCVSRTPTPTQTRATPAVPCGTRDASPKCANPAPPTPTRAPPPLCHVGQGVTARDEGGARDGGTASRGLRCALHAKKVDLHVSSPRVALVFGSVYGRLQSQDAGGQQRLYNRV